MTFISWNKVCNRIKQSIYISTKFLTTTSQRRARNENFWKWNGKFRSDKTVWSKRTTVVYHLPNLYSPKSSQTWKVNRTQLFGSFHRKISRSNGTSEKVQSCFSGWNIPKWKFLFHFFKAIFDTGSGNLRPFFGKWNWFVQMVNMIPGWNLPVLNSAYHLSKLWSDQFAHVNSKKPTSGGGPLWPETFYLGQTVHLHFGPKFPEILAQCKASFCLHTVTITLIYLHIQASFNFAFHVR